MGHATGAGSGAEKAAVNRLLCGGRHFALPLLFSCLYIARQRKYFVRGNWLGNGAVGIGNGKRRKIGLSCDIAHIKLISVEDF
jgi:hypothetical protein